MVVTIDISPAIAITFAVCLTFVILSAVAVIVAYINS